MSNKVLESALKLSKSQRILLVEQIWDSVASEQEAPDLSPAQKIEIDSRLKRLERTGSTGSPWSEVKKRLKKRAR